MKRILVTGGAGFIGSNLVEKLINRGYSVRVLDNLSTGDIGNLSEFMDHDQFEFEEGDIRDYQTCLKISENCAFISHQAALGSVPRSIEDPMTTNEVNIGGTLNVFHAAKELGIEKLVYAASSSTYGDSESLPKQEDVIGNPLSPYAVTKYVNELYADVYSRVYGMNFIGLRYFNVFGPKQKTTGPYAAVIPLFIDAALNKKKVMVYGDGEQSRDFTYVANAVQANILSLESDESVSGVFNIAGGLRTTINQLIEEINHISESNMVVEYGKKRKGDIPHSLAKINKARKNLAYDPLIDWKNGLALTYKWFKGHV